MTLTHPRPSLTPTPDALLSLAHEVRGDLLRPGSELFEAAWPVWNAAVTERPAALLRPVDAADVAAAVRCAASGNWPLAVRSGGHSPAGHGTVQGGLVLDLSSLRGLDIDPVRRTARIEPGLTWGEVAQALHPHGLALTSGDTSTVGVGGLTLGGGIGWMARRYGLALDRLRAVELVTARGEVLRASATSHPELFWALRGGGANFGVATAFEFDLHEGGTVLGGAVFYDAGDPEHTARMLRAYADHALSAPDELSTQAILIAAPPAPFVPEGVVGRPLLGILMCSSGDHAAGEAVVAPLRSLGPQVADLVGPMPYPAIFRLAEVGTLRGFGHHSRSLFFDEFGADDALALATAALTTLNPGSLVQLRALGGALGRVPREETAFAHRDRKFLLLASNFSPDPADAARCQAASDAVWSALARRGLGLYGNFAGPAEEGRTQDVYPAPTLARLAGVKRRYDPENLFARNVNVRPA